jgi:hypothetical protein
MKFLLNSISLVFLLSATKCEEYFSSLVQLEKLAVQEGQLVEKLQAVANEVNDEYVKKYVVKLFFIRVRKIIIFLKKTIFVI